MTKDRPTRKARLRAHAQERALERFGLKLTRKDMDAVAATIEATLAGKLEPAPARKVAQQSQRVSVWKLEVKGVPVQVVYDESRQVPVTFLPYELKVFTGAERAEHRRLVQESLRGDVDTGDYRSLGGR